MIDTEKYNIQFREYGAYCVYDYTMKSKRLKLVDIITTNRDDDKFIHNIIDILHDIVDTYGNIEDIFLPLIDVVSNIHSIGHSFSNSITVFFEEMIDTIKYKGEIEQINYSLSAFGLTIFEAESNYLNIRIL